MKSSISISSVIEVCAGSAPPGQFHAHGSPAVTMKPRNLICGLALTLLAVVPALAGTSWFVDGVNGNDSRASTGAVPSATTAS